MRNIIIAILISLTYGCLFAQNTNRPDLKQGGSGTIIRLDDSQKDPWSNSDGDSPIQNTQILGNERVNFFPASEGIFINVLYGNNKITLFALTGQIMFNGELNQGHFLIKASRGIYFLRINNKSYKIICK